MPALRPSVTLLAPFAGSLAYRDRQGQQTATGTGPIRYQPAPGSRVNYCVNPRFANNLDSWVSTNGLAATRITTDAYVGSACAELVCDGSFAHQAFSPAFNIYEHQIPCRTGETVAWGFALKLVSGSADWEVAITERTASGSNLGTTTVLLTPGADWTWVGGVFTATDRQCEMIHVVLRTRAAIVSTLRVGAVLWTKQATVPTAADYFDASTVPGAAWLDPITGQLGTPHQSRSVEQPVVWVEEGTTNLVTNPWFAVNIAGWGAANGSIARTTSYRLQGPGAGLLTASAANAAAITSITAAAATHTAQWIVRNLATASRTVQLRYNGANIGSAVTLASGEQKTLTAQFTGTGASANLELVVTDSANGEQFVIYYAGAEQKAYATSPCPFINSSGNLLPGYSWSGAAHASASTRSNVNISLPAAGHLMPDRGAVAYWMSAHTIGYWSGDVFRTHIALQSFSEFDLTTRANTSNMDLLFHGSQFTFSHGISAGDMNRHFIVINYRSDEQRVYIDGVLRGTGAIAGPLTISGNVYFGSRAGTHNDGGFFGPFLFFDRPLNDNEIAALANLGPRGALAWAERRQQALGRGSGLVVGGSAVRYGGAPPALRTSE